MRRTVLYRLGIVIVAALMLLLPVLYVALVGVVIAFMVWHATNNTPSLVMGIWGVLLLYAGPLVAGSCVIVALIKPIFARAPASKRGREVPLGAEPLLHAFVSRIASAVGAPQPRRIELNWEVNAYAGFAGGLFGRQLVLVLGLPLVAGLSLPEMAGVLAHELGHFTQGGGMRLSYIVRSINGWFSRAVFHRDAWDDALVQWCDESGRVALVFYLARLAVWLTRGVLLVFLLVAHGLSCFLERQMEYDADRFAARLIGSKEYESASRRIMLLIAGGLVVEDTVIASLRGAALPDDLPGLIVARVQKMSQEDERRLHRAMGQTRTGMFDTHPAFPDRMANVRREKAPGVFHLDLPANVLFGDYRKLSRRVTRDLYQSIFGRKIRRRELVTTTAFVAEGSIDSSSP